MADMAEGSGTYPEPEFPIGYVTHTNWGGTLTVVAHVRPSPDDVRDVPWLYVLRGPVEWQEHTTSANGIRDLDAVHGAGRPRFIPVTQRGRLTVGDRLRSPRGLWTVARSRSIDEQGKELLHRIHTLTHDDGHEEEWPAPDMVDFHRVLPDQQKTMF